MCVNFRPPDPAMLEQVMGVLIDLHDAWKMETWKDYLAPIVRTDAQGQRVGDLASYGMVPRRHIPPGVKVFDTMNARAETLGQLRSYSQAWRHGQLCLVPMVAFYEPSYESGKAERWGIGMPGGTLFAVAGLWRQWQQDDGPALSFTQITINADEHALMRRFHKPGDEKRSLVIVPPEEWDAWLNCRDPELARSFLRHFPHEEMCSWPEPLPPRPRKGTAPVSDAAGPAPAAPPGHSMGEGEDKPATPVQASLL
jgi:putative SOS response-associated peptidase YedK